MSSEPRRRYRYRWLLRTCGVVIALLVAVLIALYFTGEQIAQRVLRDKLQELISGQLNARLDIGSVNYHFPYSVTVGDVSLVTTSPEGGDLTLMSFKALDITLAQFPLKKGPLVIERVDFDRPTVHLIETKNGFIGETSLVRSPDQKKADTTPPPPLTQVLQLRHVAFTDGRVEYEDRTVAGSQPLAWGNLNAGFDSQPVAGASHRFAFSAENGDAAKVDAHGTLDLDSLVLAIDDLTLNTTIHSNQTNGALPAEVQRVLKASGVGGRATISVRGKIPLLHTRDIDASGDLRIDQGQCVVPGYDEPVQDLTLVATGEYRNRAARATVQRFDCRTASIGLSAQPLSGTFNRNSGRWIVDPLRAAVVYEPVNSEQRFWRQKISLIIRAGVHQLERKSEVEVVLDGTTISPQGLAGDVSLAGTLVYYDGQITVRPTTVAGLGGAISLSGLADLRTRVYGLNAAADSVDLAKVNVVLDPTAKKEMHGTLKGRARLQMIETFDNLTGEGAFRITDGQFARVPVLSPIAEFLHFGGKAFVANDAFGHFKMSDHRLDFDRIAVSTSVLRIRGQGKIGFDQSLDLKVYADSASNWKQNVEKTGIPLFSNLVGAVAGGTQSVIGGVSKQFTSLSVTGTIDKPKIRPAPAPMLTDNLNKLFRAVE